jgi:hypothetical protein
VVRHYKSFVGGFALWGEFSSSMTEAND